MADTDRTFIKIFSLSSSDSSMLAPKLERRINGWLATFEAAHVHVDALHQSLTVRSNDYLVLAISLVVRVDALYIKLHGEAAFATPLTDDQLQAFDVPDPSPIVAQYLVG